MCETFDFYLEFRYILFEYYLYIDLSIYVFMVDIFYGFDSICTCVFITNESENSSCFACYIGVNTNAMALKFFTYILGSITGVRQTIG